MLHSCWCIFYFCMNVFEFMKLPEIFRNFLKLLSIFYDLISISRHQKPLFLFPLPSILFFFVFLPTWAAGPFHPAPTQFFFVFPLRPVFLFSHFCLSFRPTPARQLFFFLFFSPPPTGESHLLGSLSTPSQGRTRVRRAFPPRLGPHGPHAKAKLASAAPPFSPP